MQALAKGTYIRTPNKQITKNQIRKTQAQKIPQHMLYEYLYIMPQKVIKANHYHK